MTIGKDSFRILTKRGSGHRETEVTIDWDGITPEQLKLLARNAIVHDLQARISKLSETFPEKAFIKASDVANRRPVALDQWQPPESTTTIKVDDKLEALLKKLSPEEVLQLLS